MDPVSDRRRFIAQLGAAAASLAVSGPGTLAATSCQKKTAKSAPPGPRVAIARDPALMRGAIGEHVHLLRKMLDAALVRLRGTQEPGAAWRSVFGSGQRIGIKVNALGLSTQPAVVEALVAALVGAGVPAQNILIWDRFDIELVRAGFELNKSGRGPRCYGTDARSYGTGYQREVQVSGQIGSCFSRIVAEQVDALISVPVLKDHNLAGASLGMKNFFGAIHNPNKYHENNCDPFVADVVSHPYIARKWKLTVCDATEAQYHGGPTRSPDWAWRFGGLIVGDDVVATDAVAADLIDVQRRAAGMKPLAQDGRPAKHIATAGGRGLGQADLKRVERIEI